MLDTVLAYLKDPANRAILAWLGGGLVIVATGFWVVIKFFLRRELRPLAITVDHGGIAVGGNATNNTFSTTGQATAKRPPGKA